MTMSEDDKDAAVAEELRQTFAKGENGPASPPPKERETAPELPDDVNDLLEELKRELSGKVMEAVLSAAGAAGKFVESISLIGPSLARIADAHEKMASEAKIFNDAYEHNVNQAHHSVHG
jgi:hypothetical protein